MYTVATTASALTRVGVFTVRGFHLTQTQPGVRPSTQNSLYHYRRGVTMYDSPMALFITEATSLVSLSLFIVKNIGKMETTDS